MILSTLYKLKLDFKMLWINVRKYEVKNVEYVEMKNHGILKKI